MTSSEGAGKGPGEGEHPGGPKDPKFEIKIDRTHYEVREAALTGAQLRGLPEPDIGADRDLFEVVPGGSDRKIADTMSVTMRNGLRFFTAPAQINPGQA
jgi:hypothetical protein